LLLVVCPECEQVICFECISQHQLVVNNNVQQNWMNCKDQWNLIYEKSSKFKFFIFLKTISFFKVLFIEKRSNFLLEMIEQCREIYHNKINQYSETYEVIRQELKTQFQSIDQRTQIFAKFVQTDP
jgi:DNA-directed RNA polymerase beta' subunit